MPDAAVRYALYYAPEANSAWWQQGSAWLGRCAITGEPLPQPKIPEVTAPTLARLTAEPRRYGLHATLKAPFRLADGCPLSDLLAAGDRYARAQTTFTLPPLRVEHLPDFLALTLTRSDARSDAIAADCVTQFDQFRAPLTAQEFARRQQAPLDTTELALLERWGYPYVLDRFRFHFSLTGPLTGVSAPVVTALRSAADALASALVEEPVRFDAVCVFEQARAGADFRLLHRAAFKS